MRRKREFLADESGASLVEFALVTPLFLGLLLMILQMGVLEVMSVNFNNGLLAASREIRVGNPPNNAEKFKEAICAGMVGVADKCKQRMNVQVVAITTFAGAAASAQAADAPQANNSSNEEFDGGEPGEVMLVTAKYRWPFWAPFVGEAFPRVGNDVVLTSRLTFKNEPYNQ